MNNNKKKGFRDIAEQFLRLEEESKQENQEIRKDGKSTTHD
jgi:hypothetical protein